MHTVDPVDGVLRLTADYAARFQATLDDRPVRAQASFDELCAALGGPLPETGTADEEVVAELIAGGEPGVVGTQTGRYFGFVIGSALPAAVAADWLATAWDQNAALGPITPGVSRIEAVALRWLLDVLGLPPGSQGAFVTGATMANFTALAAARHAQLARAGWNVEADGLFDAPPVTVIVGEEAHPTLLKALGLLGLGRRRVVRLPVDRQGRVRAEALPKLHGPTIVCLQAGNINTGAFDPFDEICAAARAAGAWVHVDGAFGLWAAASPTHRHLVAGIEQADSWAADGHKWLNVPYDCGYVFCADPEAHAAAMSYTAAYLAGRGDEAALRSPSDYVLESSRRARGFATWAALRELGRDGLAELVERCCALARRFGDRLAEIEGVEIGNEIVLNQALARFGSDERTDALVDAVQRDGTCWMGGTTWGGRRYMRISVSNWSTTESDVDRSVEAIRRLLGGLS